MCALLGAVPKSVARATEARDPLGITEPDAEPEVIEGLGREATQSQSTQSKQRDRCTQAASLNGERVRAMSSIRAEHGHGGLEQTSQTRGKFDGERAGRANID